MDTEDLIIKYFERDISDEEMKLMFNKIGSDDNMMNEFKNYWMLDYATKQCADSFSPPTYVVNNIYSKLGYTIPSGTASAQVKNSIFSRANLWGNVLSGILGIILTLSVMLIFFYPTANQAFVKEAGTKLNATESTNNQIPKIESKTIAIPEKNINSNNSHSKLLEHSVNQESTQLPVETNLKNEISYSTESPVSMNQINNSKKSFTNLSYHANRNYYNLYMNEPIGLTLGINNTPSWDIHNNNIQFHTISSFNNLCLSLSYKVDDIIKIGTEARQETFHTEYTGIEPNDTAYLYKSQTNLTTFSLISRFDIYDFYNFYTYLGLNFGINNGGFITRPNIGIEYHAYPDLAFALSFEYSYFRFTHQNNWFGASKVGVNYGVHLNF
ncbi:MAG: hypothetical protein HZB41_10195 [Ignavibacteriae bacterium]|nr:hypothetical protein [Ignavibacteriota bacterium]